jgi:Glycosyl transferase family 2
MTGEFANPRAAMSKLPEKEPSSLMPSRNALVSVIMPCYNAAPYVQQAIESALGQSYGDVELIFVDDGSSDASLDVRELMLLGRCRANDVVYFGNADKLPFTWRGFRFSDHCMRSGLSWILQIEIREL